MDETEQLALITLLSVDGVGNRRALELVRMFGSASKALTAPAGEISSAIKVPLAIGRGIVRAGKLGDVAQKIFNRIREIGAKIVTIYDAEYPARLKEIPDPPVLYYLRGEYSPLFQYAISVVGTRTPSDHSRKVARQIAQGLGSRGVTVVSGMALGIDSIAHEGALQAGGRTIAVLGSGIDVIYPPSNRKLYDRICKQGAVITEYPPGTTPEPHHFPQRNRIISGISIGTVIIEAGHKSGALITATTAIEQGRELFAVPGPAGSPKCAGNNRLLKDGTANMIETADEIIENLRSRLAPVLNVAASLAVPNLAGAEQKIYTLLENSPMLVDDLIRQSGISAVELNRLLTSMQLKGLVKRCPGARVERA
jgi:DNA processing protein